MLSLYQIKVLGERFFHYGGKHRVPVIVSLTSPDYDLVTGEVDVLLFERYSFTVSFGKSPMATGTSAVPATYSSN